jgi:hypothetical protein
MDNRRPFEFLIGRFREVVENLINSVDGPFWRSQTTLDFVWYQTRYKKQIRIAAEEEELESYESRMSSDWLDDLKPLSSDWHKPF